VGGWIALRMVALWPSAATVERTLEAIATAAAAAARKVDLVETPTGAGAHSTGRAVHRFRPRAAPPAISPPVDPTMPVPPSAPVPSTAAREEAAAVMPPPYRLPALSRTPTRWRASMWAIGRGGVRGSLLGGQLGGSQAGGRVIYAVAPAHRVALAGRVATPLDSAGKEAALGVDWQPVAAAPVHLIVEQRIGLDGQPGGPTALVIGGIGPSAIGPALTVEGYGEMGVIARDHGVGFADGALRVTHGIVRRGAMRVDLGIGGWAGVQPGVTRGDVGPTIGVALPVAARSVRVTLDWRQRVVGNAAPGSGLALSLGSDF